MLRLKRRGLETEPRITLHGHEGGNPGYGQGRSYGPPRQSSTLPPMLYFDQRRCKQTSGDGVLSRDNNWCSQFSPIPGYI